MMKTYAELFQLKVLIDGKPIQEYHKDERTFVEGRQGSNFSLELTNLTPRRILVHPTVDGLSAMSGKEASRLDDDGYVLHAFQKTTIPGWRLNNDEVARFFFAGAGKSYAEKTGKGRDKGVIACAVWEEKVVAQAMNFFASAAMPSAAGCAEEENTGGELHTQMCSYESGEFHSKATFDSMSSETRTKGVTRGAGGQRRNSMRRERKCSTQNLGAGFGERAKHEVHETHFDKATDSPVVIATIYYDDLKGLRAQGINIRRQKSKRLPNPFPADKGCNPPNGWRG